MDAASAQQLVAAIQVLAVAAAVIPPPPAPPAPAALAADPLTSPYEGGLLDLASWHGSSLFHDGALALASKFTGKVNTLKLFLANLTTRAKMCRWDHPTHGILTVAIGSTNYNLLKDYGKITEPQVQAAWMACNAADASPRAKQNSQMMYECLMASSQRRQNQHSPQGTKIFMKMGHPCSTMWSANSSWPHSPMHRPLMITFQIFTQNGSSMT